MKKRYIFALFLTLLSYNGFAQKQKPSPLEVINHTSKFIVFYTSGAKEDLGQEMKVAFFKDYTLFEVPTYHHKVQTTRIDFDNIKDGDTIIDDSEPDMTIEKITYKYYIFKNGQKRGLFYDLDNNKSKSFSVDTLLIGNNLGKENEQNINLELGKPNEIKKTGKKWSEKYYNFKEKNGRDTIFCEYDDTLKDIPFSLSKKLDQEQKSKLTKSIQFIKYPQSFEIKKIQPLKLEIIDEIELFTNKCSKGQLEKFQRLFGKYEIDSKTNTLSPY